jgi:NAD(P)-dependent dehydrogenase (short-subunit alcohol dehydrogenase family)
VNTISPGADANRPVAGRRRDRSNLSRASGLAPDAVTGTATGRFTHPQEVAYLVLLLAGNRTGNITGSDFIIDSGLVQTS